jgi:hypothetical protein
MATIRTADTVANQSRGGVGLRVTSHAATWRMATKATTARHATSRVLFV